jgi:hypothetical protein
VRQHTHQQHVEVKQGIRTIVVAQDQTLADPLLPDHCHAEVDRDQHCDEVSHQDEPIRGGVGCREQIHSGASVF